MPGAGVTAVSGPVVRGAFHTCREWACGKRPCEGVRQAHAGSGPCVTRRVGEKRIRWRRRAYILGLHVALNIAFANKFAPTKAQYLSAWTSTYREKKGLLHHAFGAQESCSRQSGACRFVRAINAGGLCLWVSKRAQRAVSPVGIALAKFLLRHRASCLPYAPLGK